MCEAKNTSASLRTPMGFPQTTIITATTAVATSKLSAALSAFASQRIYGK